MCRLKTGSVICIGLALTVCAMPSTIDGGHFTTTTPRYWAIHNRISVFLFSLTVGACVMSSLRAWVNVDINHSSTSTPGRKSFWYWLTGSVTSQRSSAGSTPVAPFESKGSDITFWDYLFYFELIYTFTWRGDYVKVNDPEQSDYAGYRSRLQQQPQVNGTRAGS